jgi:hypothetical protein
MDLPDELDASKKPGQLYRLALGDMDKLMTRMEHVHAEQKEVLQQCQDLRARLVEAAAQIKVVAASSSQVERFKQMTDLLEKAAPVAKAHRAAPPRETQETTQPRAGSVGTVSPAGKDGRPRRPPWLRRLFSWFS